MTRRARGADSAPAAGVTDGVGEVGDAFPVSPRADGGCELRVSVVPNAKVTGIDGFHDGALRVRLAAPPVDGKANAALEAWLAQVLDVPKRAVAVRLGTSSRRKAVAIAAPADEVIRRLQERVQVPRG